MNIKFDMKIIFPVLTASAIVLLSAGTYFLCQPSLMAVEEAKKQQAPYLQEAFLARDLLASKNVKGIVRQLIAKEKITLVMDAVKKLAVKNNVPLTLLRPPFTEPGEEKIFSRVLFDMQATGTMRDLGDFFSVVRNMPEGLIDIESLRLVPDESRSEIVTAKISFALFVVKK